MNSKENAQSLLLNYNCKYNHFIAAYYNAAYIIHLFRDFEVYNNLSYPYILKGNLKGKGTKFMLRRPDLGVLMFYEIEEFIITDYYSRFKYYIYKTIPETFNFIHLVEVRYINEDQCDIRSSLIYDNKIFLSEKELQQTLLLKFKVYKQIEISLRDYIMEKLAIVFSVINCKIELIWNILLNMKIINKYSGIISDIVNYEGNIIQKNDIIELIFYEETNKIEKKYNAKVNKCKISKKNLTKSGLIELLIEKDEINDSQFTKNKIILRIYEFKGKSSMYIIYYFLNDQHYNYLVDFVRMKNKELYLFKNIVENYNNKIKSKKEQ